MEAKVDFWEGKYSCDVPGFARFDCQLHDITAFVFRNRFFLSCFLRHRSCFIGRCNFTLSSCWHDFSRIRSNLLPHVEASTLALNMDLTGSLSCTLRFPHQNTVMFRTYVYVIVSKNPDKKKERDLCEFSKYCAVKNTESLAHSINMIISTFLFFSIFNFEKSKLIY